MPQLVTIWSQNDPRWKDDLLGHGPATIGADGCDLTVDAMVISDFMPQGQYVTPAQLNQIYLAAGAFVDGDEELDNTITHGPVSGLELQVGDYANVAAPLDSLRTVGEYEQVKLRCSTPEIPMHFLRLVSAWAGANGEPDGGSIIVDDPWTGKRVHFKDSIVGAVAPSVAINQIVRVWAAPAPASVATATATQPAAASQAAPTPTSTEVSPMSSTDPTPSSSSSSPASTVPSAQLASQSAQMSALQSSLSPVASAVSSVASDVKAILAQLSATEASRATTASTAAPSQASAATAQASADAAPSVAAPAEVPVTESTTPHTVAAQSGVAAEVLKFFNPGNWNVGDLVHVPASIEYHVVHDLTDLPAIARTLVQDESKVSQVAGQLFGENYGRLQADGKALMSTAGLLPGWVIKIPAVVQELSKL